jgi:hypothetical protein
MQVHGNDRVVCVVGGTVIASDVAKAGLEDQVANDDIAHDHRWCNRGSAVISQAI